MPLIQSPLAFTFSGYDAGIFYRAGLAEVEHMVEEFEKLA